jgi:hypothetical protein
MMLNATKLSSKHSNASAQTSEGGTLSPEIARGKAAETAWPYLAGVIIALAHYWVWGRWHAIPSTLKETLSAVVSISGTVFGFMLAAASILVAIRSSWYLKRAKEAGLYASLIARLFGAMWWCLAVAVFSSVPLSYDPGWKLPWYPAALSFWLFCAITALGTTIRVIRIFSKLFRLISEE